MALTTELQEKIQDEIESLEDFIDVLMANQTKTHTEINTNIQTAKNITFTKVAEMINEEDDNF